MDDLSEKMENWWVAANSQAIGQKDSQAATLWLTAEYERLTPAERAVADQVLCDWATSENESKRFDALAVIEHFRVRTAAPCLRDFAGRLAVRTDPGAPFERVKIERILATLDDR